MATLDTAIIKALVEHVGGDSSGIPDGTIGGNAYTGGYNIEGITFNKFREGFAGFTADNTPPIIKFKCSNYYGNNQDITFITFVPDPSNRANQFTISNLRYEETNDVGFNGSVYEVNVSNLDNHTWSLTGHDIVDGEMMYFLFKHLEAVYQKK